MTRGGNVHKWWRWCLKATSRVSGGRGALTTAEIGWARQLPSALEPPPPTFTATATHRFPLSQHTLQPRATTTPAAPRCPAPHPPAQHTTLPAHRYHHHSLA
ncbi:hypothetical protein E2C01_012132 [Portunus trituberculatus]|uniref:Uncharacterized protein n=1 Tax=Portunus trituberculatus TaxID=210409 RepID=A0A5B7DCW8_PORTR|nr:hypothetical protein [Portunus trituberculatus]